MIFALQILCILGLIGCGFIARRRGVLSGQGTGELAKLMVALIYPALIIVSITSLSAQELIANRILPVLAMGIALSGFLLGLVIVRMLGKVEPQTAKAFLFSCLINNYLFLPLPLVLFLFGEKGVALLVFSSIGYELLLWTLGVFLFTHQVSLTERMRQLMSPPFLTLLGSLGYVFLRDLPGWSLPAHLAAHIQPIRETFVYGAQLLGQATIAISMLIGGSRFAVLRFKSMLGWRIWLVSVVRLVVIPLMLLPVLNALPLEPVTRGILMIISVMPSAMASVIFSERFGGDGEFIASALLLTHLWALITVPVFLMLWL